jgi:parallel beta-helix repeat protein
MVRHGRALVVLLVAAVGLGATVGLWGVADAPTARGDASPSAADDGDASRDQTVREAGDRSRPGVRSIDGCTVVTRPGRYALTADVTNATRGVCLRVRASDVVLDGRGHTVDGRGSFGTAGVVVGSLRGPGLDNVTVRDVTVTDWDDGVRFLNVSDGRLAGATAARTRVGVTLLASRDVVVADVLARDNALYGVSVVDGSRDNRVVNATARDNSLYGVHVVEATETRVANVTAARNEFGVVVVGGRGNAVVGGRATENRIAGAWLSGTRDATVTRLRLSNRFYGVFLADGTERSRVVGVVADGNPVGVRLRNSDRNRVAANTVRNSSDTAVLLIESEGNRVVDNRGRDNARGVSLVRARNNTVMNNSLTP